MEKMENNIIKIWNDFVESDFERQIKIQEENNYIIDYIKRSYNV